MSNCTSDNRTVSTRAIKMSSMVTVTTGDSPLLPGPLLGLTVVSNPVKETIMYIL